MNRPLTALQDAQILSRYYRENADHLIPWEPQGEAGYHDLIAGKVRLRLWEIEHVEGSGAHFIACNDNHEICSHLLLEWYHRWRFPSVLYGVFGLQKLGRKA